MELLKTVIGLKPSSVTEISVLATSIPTVVAPSQPFNSYTGTLDTIIKALESKTKQLKDSEKCEEVEIKKCANKFDMVSDVAEKGSTGQEMNQNPFDILSGYNPIESDGSTLQLYQLHKLLSETKHTYAQELIECNERYNLKLGSSFWNKVKSCVDKVLKTREAIKCGLTEDEAIALTLYTTNPFYPIMNCAFKPREGPRKEAFDHFRSCVCSLKHFTCGFRKLEFNYGEVYRGMHMSLEELLSYEVGDIMRFKSMVSCSTDPKVAMHFAVKKPKAGHYRIVMHITSNTGRSLEAFSFYPSEHEVCFRPNTHFRIKSITETTIKANEDELDVVLFKLEQEHEDLSSRKVIFWVDDNPINSKELKAKLQREEQVSYAFLKSTTAFYLAITNNWDSLKETLPDEKEQLKVVTSALGNVVKYPFRVISDMVRKEEGKNNIEAGLDLYILLLALGYLNDVVIFTGKTYLKDNQSKFALYPNVRVLTREDECLTHARFKDNDLAKPNLTPVDRLKLIQRTEFKDHLEKVLINISQELKQDVRPFFYSLCGLPFNSSSKFTSSPEVKQTSSLIKPFVFDVLKEKKIKKALQIQDGEWSQTMTKLLEKTCAFENVIKSSKYAVKEDYSFALRLNLMHKATRKRVPQYRYPMIDLLSNGSYRCFVNQPPHDYKIMVAFEVIHQPKHDAMRHSYNSQVEIDFITEDNKTGKAALTFKPWETSVAHCTCGDYKEMELPQIDETAKESSVTQSAKLNFWYGPGIKGDSVNFNPSEQSPKTTETGLDTHITVGSRRREAQLVGITLGDVVNTTIATSAGIIKQGPPVVMDLLINVKEVLTETSPLYWKP